MGKGAAALLAASMAAGCVLVTGSTDGYHVQVAEAGCGEGGPCQPACTSSADCGDSGDVCCLVTIASIRTTTLCMPAPCVPALPVQLCRSDGAGDGGTDECPDGSTCTAQTCPGSLLPLSVCGTIPGCSRN